jgi:hypothetical protein
VCVGIFCEMPGKARIRSLFRVGPVLRVGISSRTRLQGVFIPFVAFRSFTHQRFVQIEVSQQLS